MNEYFNNTTFNNIYAYTLSDNYYYSGNTIVNNLSYYYNNLPNYEKDVLVKNILDKVIEIKSLIEPNSYDFFEIKKISFLKNKSKIICSKEIDLEYFEELQEKSKIINELIDDDIDDYKDKTLNFIKNPQQELKKDNISWTTTGTYLNINSIGNYVTYISSNNYDNNVSCTF